MFRYKALYMKDVFIRGHSFNEFCLVTILAIDVNIGKFQSTLGIKFIEVVAQCQASSSRTKTEMVICFCKDPAHTASIPRTLIDGVGMERVEQAKVLGVTLKANYAIPTKAGRYSTTRPCTSLCASHLTDSGIRMPGAYLITSLRTQK